MKLYSTIHYKLLLGVAAFVLLLTAKQSSAQYTSDYRYPDSVFMTAHSPNKAAFYSMVMPGLGQIYNQKYWKVPIIYAGFCGVIYYTNYTNYVYNRYKDGYNIKLRIIDGEIGLDDKFPGRDPENLRRSKDTWRRYRDMNLVALGAIYVFQILDASVDAHLFDYDVSEDLSMRMHPTLLPGQLNNSNSNSSPVLGVTCAIKF